MTSWTADAAAPAVTVRLVHRTVYHYGHKLSLGPQVVRLRPLPDVRRPALPYRLLVTPADASVSWQADPWGNLVARLVMQGALDRLALEVSLGLDLTPGNPFDFLLDPAAASWPFAYDAAAADALAPFRRCAEPGPLLAELVRATSVAGETVAFLLTLAPAVLARVAYTVRMEAGVWTPEQTLATGRGSCRDSAWLLVQLLRQHGVAARFVSGYLVQTPEDGSPRQAELHAWAEAYLPGAGWIGLDATSGLLTAEGHVGLAAGPSPDDAAPLSGTVEPGVVRLETTIQLVPA